MCEYTKVEFACGHLRYTVRAWCIKYEESHKRCPANVVAIEYRLDEKCGDCRDTSSKHWALRRKASTIHQSQQQQQQQQQQAQGRKNGAATAMAGAK